MGMAGPVMIVMIVAMGVVTVVIVVVVVRIVTPKVEVVAMTWVVGMRLTGHKHFRLYAPASDGVTAIESGFR